MTEWNFYILDFLQPTLFFPSIRVKQKVLTWEGYRIYEKNREELRLNAVIAKWQLMEAIFKMKAVSTGIAAMAALCLRIF